MKRKPQFELEDTVKTYTGKVGVVALQRYVGDDGCPRYEYAVFLKADRLTLWYLEHELQRAEVENFL